VALALAAGAVASGCGGGASGTPTPNAAQSPFHPTDFGTPATGANKWLPLKPGTQWVREGLTDVGNRRVPHRVVSTVTDVSKLLDGVNTTAVLDQDYDGGQLAQESLDYFAQDKRGNVWYLGSYTEEYQGGQFVNATDAWLAGVGGAEPGIAMQADPRTGTPPYSISKPPGGASSADVAQVVESGKSQCVPYKCYKDVLVIREGKASAPDNEYKYYAPGVGQILNTPRSASQHHDVEKLINLTQLSPRGLAEAGKEALKLDQHARVGAPSVFGHAPAAKRTL
jgi:hypothetical protein